MMRRIDELRRVGISVGPAPHRHSDARMGIASPAPLPGTSKRAWPRSIRTAAQTLAGRRVLGRFAAADARKKKSLVRTELLTASVGSLQTRPPP